MFSIRLASLQLGLVKKKPVVEIIEVDRILEVPNGIAAKSGDQGGALLPFIDPPEPENESRRSEGEEANEPKRPPL